MDQVEELRQATELDLRHALERGELEVYYQPIIKVAGEAVSGYEALMRWKHPARGFISPAVFIQTPLSQAHKGHFTKKPGP